MAYWQFARGFSIDQAGKFALWNLLPAVVGAGISLLLHLQPIQQVVITLAVAAASYLLLYALEFLWYLLIKAPVARERGHTEKIGNLQERLRLAEAALQVKLKRTPDEEHHFQKAKSYLETLPADAKDVLCQILLHERLIGGVLVKYTTFPMIVCIKF